VYQEKKGHFKGRKKGATDMEKREVRQVRERLKSIDEEHHAKEKAARKFCEKGHNDKKKSK